MMKKISIIAVLLVALLCLAACGGGESETAGGLSLSGMESVDIFGNDVDAAVFQSVDLTMVNFWSTTCPPCIRELPDLGELNAAIDGFQVVGVVLNLSEENMDALADVYDIVAEQRADYPHLVVSESLYEAKVKDIQYVPETIFVDADGRQVGEDYVGAKSFDDWRDIAEALLEQVR